jgi:hypothetical protein
MRETPSRSSKPFSSAVLLLALALIAFSVPWNAGQQLNLRSLPTDRELVIGYIVWILVSLLAVAGTGLVAWLLPVRQVRWHLVAGVAVFVSGVYTLFTLSDAAGGFLFTMGCIISTYAAIVGVKHGFEAVKRIATLSWALAAFAASSLLAVVLWALAFLE